MEAVSIPLGKSTFIEWGQLDNAINCWAKSYFGDHVYGFGERDETGFSVGFRYFKPSDFEKYSRLYEQYDKEDLFDSEEEFGQDPFDTILPESISLRLLHEILPDQGLRMYGTIVATYDGVFVMENDLDETRDRISSPREVPQNSLFESRIQEASTQAGANFDAQKQRNDVTNNLINALVQYALEYAWNDSEAIDALVGFGITQEDFQKAGMGDFVKSYFDDEPEHPDIDSLIQSAAERVGENQNSSVEQNVPER